MKTSIGFSDGARVWPNRARIRSLREVRGLSKDQLSERAGVALGVVEIMEGKLSRNSPGRCRWISLGLVAQVLDFNPYQLLDLELPQPLPPDVSLEDLITAHTRNPELGAARELLATIARSGSSATQLRRSLEKSIAGVRPLLKRDVIYGAARTLAALLARLAELEQRFDLRIALRREAIEVLDSSYSNTNDVLDLISCADSAVNYHHDCGVQQSRKYLPKVLRRLLDQTVAAQENWLGDAEQLRIRVLLLSQATSMHRCHAAFVSGDENRRRKYRTMLDCGRKTLEIDGSSSLALIACGQALWVHGSWVTGSRSVEYLQAAEAQLRIAARQSTLGKLVLSRFYRQTYRQREALDYFRQFESAEGDRRLVLGESHIAAESARQLWLKKRSAVSGDVEYARNLVAEAVEAGFGDARHICDLAFLEAICGNPTDGGSVLGRLLLDHDANGASGWQDLIYMAIEYANNGDVEHLHKVFVHGIDQGASWNSLGTFALDFMNDPSAALSLYEAGLKLSNNDHILWFNKAQVLRTLGREEEVGYCVRQARRTAHTAFLPFIEQFTAEETRKQSIDGSRLR